MIEVVHSSIRKAKKDHHDDSTEFIQNGLLDHYIIDAGLSFSEWRAIAKLKANGWKIKKGQVYERQVNKMDGDIYTFKSLPEIIKICQKLDLYVE